MRGGSPDTPCQGTHLLSVGRLIVVSDQAYHHCVISKFDDDIGAVCSCTVMCVQGVQEWAEDAAFYRWERAVCRVKAIASSVERLLRYANCSGSSEAGRAVVKSTFVESKTSPSPKRFESESSPSPKRFESESSPSPNRFESKSKSK